MSSLSCPGCLPTGKALHELYESVKKKAIAFKDENKVSVAIYRDIEGFNYTKAEIAFSEGCQIKEVISYYENE